MRLLLALVLLLGASLIAPGANAHTGGGHTSRQQAWEHCKAVAVPDTYFTCKLRPGRDPPDMYDICDPGNNCAYGNFAWITGQDCPAGTAWDETTHTCKATCVAGTGSSGVFASTISPTSCNPDGCSVNWTKDGAPYVVVGTDGVPRNYQRWNGVTSGGAFCAIAPDADGDGTPDEDDIAPADPSEHTDSDGDGIGDNADAMPSDPTNGEDTGIGDETDNTSAGGGTCSAPPTSSGDAIAAQIAYQTWATRCAVEKLNAATTGNGGSGSGPGGGDGTDMTETNELLTGIRDGVDGLTDLEGADVNAGLGDGSGEPTPGSVMKETTYLADGFDMSGFGWGTTCPAIPSFTVKGHTIQLDPDGKFCDFMILGGWFVLVIMSLKCLRMLGAA